MWSSNPLPQDYALPTELTEKIRGVTHGDGRKWATSNLYFNKFENAKFSETSIPNGGSKLKFKVFWVTSSKKVREFGWT